MAAAHRAGNGSPCTDPPVLSARQVAWHYDGVYYDKIPSAQEALVAEAGIAIVGLFLLVGLLTLAEFLDGTSS